ncbi:MAG: glycosyltransferase family 2 protein [Cyanobacteria bacterium P01_H01_bin.35]
MSNFEEKKSVYIIIPVHNRKHLTLGCLEHLTKTGDSQKYHIVVIDDGSTDGTTEDIKAQYPDVIVLPGDGDLWWTGAIATGMNYAYKQGAEYFIWLNDDCLPDSNTLSLLIEFSQKNPDTIIAPTCYPENSNIPVFGGFLGRQRIEGEPGKVNFVDGMSGYCVLIPRKVYDKIGPPNAKRFPQYSGDDTYTLKATRSGFKACIVGDIKAKLIGPIRQTHKIENYVKPGESPKTTFQQLFLAKKSPYYIPTKLFYHTAKYGIFLGTAFFLAKMSLWLVQWTQLQLTSKKVAV